MRLDERPEAKQLEALRFAADDRVRIPHRNRRQLDLLAPHRDRLGLPHLDGADVELDLRTVAHPGRHLARTHADPHLLRAAAPGEPACGDARTVSGELGRRAVRVPDHDLRPVAVGRDHLEDPVRADAEVVVADTPDLLGREWRGELVPLHEQVVVPEPVPLRELHPAPARLPSISVATSAGGRSARTGTSPGIRRIHLRWYAA